MRRHPLEQHVGAGLDAGGSACGSRGRDLEVCPARLDDAGVAQRGRDVLTVCPRLDDDVDLALARAGEVLGLGLAEQALGHIGASTL